jgi:hypothetical protein
VTVGKRGERRSTSNLAMDRRMTITPVTVDDDCNYFTREAEEMRVRWMKRYYW